MDDGQQKFKGKRIVEWWIIAVGIPPLVLIPLYIDGLGIVTLVSAILVFLIGSIFGYAALKTQTNYIIIDETGISKGNRLFRTEITIKWADKPSVVEKPYVHGFEGTVEYRLKIRARNSRKVVVDSYLTEGFPRIISLVRKYTEEQTLAPRSGAKHRRRLAIAAAMPFIIAFIWIFRLFFMPRDRDVKQEDLSMSSKVMVEEYLTREEADKERSWGSRYYAEYEKSKASEMLDREAVVGNLMKSIHHYQEALYKYERLIYAGIAPGREIDLIEYSLNKKLGGAYRELVAISDTNQYGILIESLKHFTACKDNFSDVHTPSMKPRYATILHELGKTCVMLSAYNEKQIDDAVMYLEEAIKILEDEGYPAGETPEEEKRRKTMAAMKKLGYSADGPGPKKLDYYELVKSDLAKAITARTALQNLSLPESL